MRKIAIFTFGRFQPITRDHQHLGYRMDDLQKTYGGDKMVFTSHTQDSKKNPLTYNYKKQLIQKVFPDSFVESPSKTIMQVLQEIYQRGYHDLHGVFGSDRTEEMHQLINKYNGREYAFGNIIVHSAGIRDPDNDNSGSKLRAHAAINNLEHFRNGLPEVLRPDAEKIMKRVRTGLNLNEQFANFITQNNGILTEIATEFTTYYEQQNPEDFDIMVQKQKARQIDKLLEQQIVIPTVVARTTDKQQPGNIGLDQTLAHNANNISMQQRRSLKRFKAFIDD